MACSDFFEPSLVYGTIIAGKERRDAEERNFSQETLSTTFDLDDDVP